MIWIFWYGGKPGQKVADQTFLDNTKGPIEEQIRSRIKSDEQIEVYTDEIHVHSKFGHRLIGRAIPA
jgi:hypothetical protein